MHTPVSASSRYQQRLERFIHEVSVYPVSCERLAAGRGDEEWLDAVLEGGARIVQLRDKESDDRRLFDKALYFRRRTSEAGALFLVNDRVDVALAADADGVHLGQRDLPPGVVRTLAPDLLIGISCNTLDQARTLRRLAGHGTCPVSYYNIGPLYPTGTKEGLATFLGPGAIAEFSHGLDLPFTVMGGIKLEHVPELAALGARRIAVVTAISQAPDMTEATRTWVRTIARERERHGKE